MALVSLCIIDIKNDATCHAFALFEHNLILFLDKRYYFLYFVSLIFNIFDDLIMLSLHCVNGLVDQNKVDFDRKSMRKYVLYCILWYYGILNYESLLAYTRGKFIPKHCCIIVFLIFELILGMKQSGL